ncbi:MAG: PilZ domain-containing protein [Polyangia bacterium]
MTSLSGELRESSRLRLVMPAVCRHAAGAVRALVQDISREGIFLRLAEYVPPGAISGIELTLPEEPVPLVLAVSARFIGRTPSGFGVGARIVDPAPAERRRWERFYTRLLRGAVECPDASCGRVLISAGALPAGLAAQLAEQGRDVVHARDNREVLPLLGPDRSDVVLAEMHDARLGGVALCRHIRRSRALARVAIVLVTDGGSASDFLAGLDAGAAYVIARPFSAAYCASRIAAAAREPGGSDERAGAHRARVRPAPAATGPQLLGTELGAEVAYLHAPSALPPCIVQAADRISDAYFVAKLVARSQLRRLKRALDR